MVLFRDEKWPLSAKTYDGSSWYISFALHMLAHFVIGLLVGLIVTVLSLPDIGKAKVGPFECDRIIDQPLIISKKFYISLSKERTLKMRTNSVKEQH